VREALAAAPGAAEAGGPAPETMATLQRVAALVGVLTVPWIILLVQSGILMGVFTALLGGQATFRQYLAVGAHAGLVGAVGQLLTLPLIVQRGSASASISLGVLVPPGDGFLPAFLGVLNVFLIWQVALLGVGVAAVNRSRSAATPLAVLFGIFLAVAAAVALFQTR
jgi:hypothetical protein